MTELSLAHARCRICERPLVDGRFDDAACEVCGIYLHFSCWRDHVASSAERAALAAAVAEANAPGPTQTVAVSGDAYRFQFDVRLDRRPCDDFFERLIIVCAGCRS